MKTFSLILALTLAACGSSGPPPVTCDAGLCSGVCCAAGQICYADPSSGLQSCATTCTLSSVCPTANPCCEPVIVGGNYNGTSICAPNPPNPDAYQCTCGNTTDCLGKSCVPATDNSAGALSGPYVCEPNDGNNHHGCGSSSICSVSQQYCAKDSHENSFCSYVCTSDTDCNNPGVACCNAPCRSGAASCCGLCGH